MATIPPKADLEILYRTHTDEAIALQCGVGASTVRRWRRRYGILSKPKGPRTEAERRFRDVPDADIKAAVAECLSVMGVCRKVGLCETGFGHAKMKQRIQELGLDTSHFGSRHVRVLGNAGSKQLLDLLLTDNSVRASSNLKRRLVNEGRLVEVCALCGVSPIWQGRPLVLHLDHINGCHKDNRLENLRLLCPNCHSQTSTYAGRNKTS